MKIAVFGDSFTDRKLFTNRTDESWMQFIEDKGYQVYSYGVSGTSTYWSYENFISNYKNYDYIIFSYSCIDRIQSLPKSLSTFSGYRTVKEFYDSGRISELNKEEEITLVKILDSYLPNYNHRFNQFVQQKVFDEINFLCKKQDIKLINLLPFVSRFDDPYFNLNNDFTHGPCLYNLLAVSEKEIGPDFAAKIGKGRFLETRYCHLSKENNRVLADLCLDNFTNYNKQMVNLYECPKFVY